MVRAARSVSAALALLAIASTHLAAQSVAEIVERMFDSYERQAEGVDNYTLVQSVLGVETTSYFEKEMIDGRPVFTLRDSGVSGFSLSLGDDDAGVGDFFLWGDELAEHGRYAGREQIGSSAVHVLAVDDLSQLDIAQPTTPDDMEFEPRTARIFVDDALMVPRRMEFVGDARTDTGPHEVTVRVDLENYLPIESLLIPYRTVVNIEGLGAAIDPEMRAQLEEMERQLAAMPADQRQMMERMLGPQMEQIQQMMAGGGDAMTIEVTVVDVVINAGRE
ncbi:MAG TPA: hypothetical protein VM198_09660 [Longimicrobiales bacterium]|nr:hypothetical protein [Longimicrobiales bacterium]